MQKVWQYITAYTRAIFIAMLCCVYCTNAHAGKITNLRIGQGVGNVRIVFEADSDFDYKVFTLSEPNRLVIDVKGVDVSSSVSKKTTALIVGTNPGSKYEKAQKLEVPIWSEEDFDRLINM